MVKKGHVAWNKLPRETRYCVCGCGGSFECRVTSSKNYIWGHNRRSKKSELKRIRTLKRRYSNNEIVHWSKKDPKKARAVFNQISSSKMGIPVWNSGLTKETNASVKRTSEKLKVTNRGQWTGPKNPSWTGGLHLPYGPEFDDALRESVRKRDNYTCQICGMTEEEHLIVVGTLLNVHHVDYNKLHNMMINLISLCKQCHTRTNHNRNHWKEFLMNNILKEK